MSNKSSIFLLAFCVSIICGIVLPSKGAAAPPIFILSPFEIGNDANKKLFAMDKEGLVSIKNKKIALINKDGTITNSEGKLLAVLTKNGVLKDAKGQPLVRVSPEGILDNGSGVKVYWRKDGQLAEGDKGTELKIIPKDSKAKRAASVMVFLYSSISTVRIAPVGR